MISGGSVSSTSGFLRQILLKPLKTLCFSVCLYYIVKAYKCQLHDRPRRGHSHSRRFFDRSPPGTALDRHTHAPDKENREKPGEVMRAAKTPLPTETQPVKSASLRDVAKHNDTARGIVWCAQIYALVTVRRKERRGVKMDTTERFRKKSGQIAVRLSASARRLLKERPDGFKWSAVAAGFILLIGNAGGFLRESSGFREGCRPCHMKAPAGLVENAVKSISFRVALKTLLGSHG